MEKRILSTLLLYICVSIGDIVSTVYAVKTGFYELNPFIRYLVKNTAYGVTIWFIASLLVYILALYLSRILYMVLGRRNIAYIPTIILIASRATGVAINTYNIIMYSM